MDIVSLQTGSMLKEIVGLVSKKRKAIIARPSGSVRISGTYWNGGSRSSYFLVHIASKRVQPLAHHSPPQYGGPKEDPIQMLEPGYAVIEAGVFCGKPATPTVYLHPEETLIKV